MSAFNNSTGAVMGDRELIEEARNPDFRGAMQYLRDWAALDRLLTDLADRLEALASLPVRDGWVQVPREPTREMWAASGDAFVALDCRRRPLANHDKATQAMWTAMLSAAPKPEAAG